VWQLKEKEVTGRAMESKRERTTERSRHKRKKEIDMIKE
jgi:hypothetical protein